MNEASGAVPLCVQVWRLHSARKFLSERAFAFIVWWELLQSIAKERFDNLTCTLVWRS